MHDRIVSMDESQSKWAYTGAANSENAGSSSSAAESFSWSASEYIQHEKTVLWYMALFAGGITAAGISFIASDGDVLTLVTILLITFVLAFYGSRKPLSKKYEISNGALSVDGKKFSFAEFKSFSVIKEGAISSIWLKPLGRFSPMIVIYSSPQDEQKIVEMVSDYLPHEQRELDFIDSLMKRLRF